MEALVADLTGNRDTTSRKFRRAEKKMFELSWELFIGTLAGGLSRYALPGRNPGGLVAAVVVGMAGSLSAAYLGEKFGWYRPDDFTGLAACAVGATVFLALFRFLSGTTAHSGGRENYDL